MKRRFTISRWSRSARLALSLVILAGCAGASPPETDPSPSGPPSTSSSDSSDEPLSVDPAAAATFSTQQVDRGVDDFRAVCGDCHSTGEFRGEDFQYTWRRRTAWDLFRLVTTTMPENAPGSLLDEQYVDVIAYILQMNGFEPGEEELPATRAALDQFVLDAAPHE